MKQKPEKKFSGFLLAPLCVIFFNHMTKQIEFQDYIPYFRALIN